MGASPSAARIPSLLARNGLYARMWSLQAVEAEAEGEQEPAETRARRMSAGALPPLREVVARHGLDARKSLGQHFLMDGNLTARIARAAGDLAGRHVIEVGPGPGGLTRALLATEAASVHRGRDRPRAVAAMEELRRAYPDRLTVRQGDAVGLDLAALAPEPRQVVANLPYNVATPLLVGWLRQAQASSG